MRIEHALRVAEQNSAESCGSQHGRAARRPLWFLIPRSTRGSGSMDTPGMAQDAVRPLRRRHGSVGVAVDSVPASPRPHCPLCGWRAGASCVAGGVAAHSSGAEPSYAFLCRRNGTHKDNKLGEGARGPWPQKGVGVRTQRSTCKLDQHLHRSTQCEQLGDGHRHINISFLKHAPQTLV